MRAAGWAGNRWRADRATARRRFPTTTPWRTFYERACAELAAAGYEHYEISNWALPGFRSRHNLKYWRREPYLGFGAGAHSFDGRWRWANAHDPAAYVAAIEQGRLPIEQLEEVTRAQALEEEMFLGLRQLEGIDLGASKSNMTSRLERALRGCARRGWLSVRGRVFGWLPVGSRCRTKCLWRCSTDLAAECRT